MSRFFSSKEILKVLEIFNFSFISQSGSHIKYTDTHGKVVIIPANRKEIPTGTFRSICRQASLTEEDFKNNK